MNEHGRRYRAIRGALKRLYPLELKGNAARHLDVLAAMICGIVGSQSTRLPDIARKHPTDALPESKVKQFHRWMKNESVSCNSYFLPFAQALIGSLSHTTLHLVIDGSTVGRGCVALVVGLVYRKRVLPLAWMICEGAKGHFPEELHVALVKEVKGIVPDRARVVLLGDGEFDGIRLQALMSGSDWKYVCRTAKNITLTWRGERFCFEDMREGPGKMMDVPDVLFTEEGYGPVTAICWWGERYKEPIKLVTNMECAEEACAAYRKRFGIETFFSDAKSRGFYIEKSHVSDPQRLSRLMIAAALAYYWIIYLGVVAVESGLSKRIHRSDRCDLSLFQLGLRLLDYLLAHRIRIPTTIRWS